jgi:hypothetical protein
MGASLVFHAGLLAIFACHTAHLGPPDTAEAERDRIVAMMAYLDARASREREATPPDHDDDLDDGDIVQWSRRGQDLVPGGTGSRAAAEEGMMGKAVAPSRPIGRFAIQGHADRPPVRTTQQGERDALRAGLAATFSSGSALPAARSSPWDSAADGQEARTTNGAMQAETPGDALGTGLGLSGTGEGGGGKAGVIGLADFGALGHGAGFGRGVGIGDGPGYVVHVPGIREGATSVNGRLPPDAIQRIVRQNFGRFRACYEEGRFRDPALRGRVAVRFVIGPSGAVVVAEDGGSGLGDVRVVSCIVHAFSTLEFPQPEGGPVHVMYPLQLEPI